MPTITQEFRFKSNPSAKPYVATLNQETGEVGCNCRGYIFYRGQDSRSCTHTKQLEASFPFSMNLGTAEAITADIEAMNAAPAPMLASAMTKDQTIDDFQSPTWVLEEKFDGHRVVVVKREGAVNAWSRPRNGKQLPKALPPHIFTALLDLPDGIYDGELILPGGVSSDVTTTETRHKLQLVLFDALEIMGRIIGDDPYHARVEALALSVKHHRGNAITTPLIQVVTRETVEAIWRRGGEGAILKRRDSTYSPGARSKDWVKVKLQGAAECTIIGFQAGLLGPYSVTLLRDDAGIETSVKTLNNFYMQEFAKDPDAYIGRRLVIAYWGRFEGGQYRHPMFDHLLDTYAPAERALAEAVAQ